jgi:hypothetical protein
MPIDRQILLSSATMVLLACVAMAQSCGPAWAYRPFDGTDAAVAGPGELEIELKPAGTLQQGSDKTLIAPATVVNIGLPDRWEAVFQGQGQFPLAGSDQPAALTGAGAFLKHVLRPGSLQGESGPSIAAEFGALLPGINADAGFGTSVAAIVSQRWEWGTVHFNSQTTLTRDHHADQFISTILEGPSQWKIRPVAEIFYEEEFGQSHTISGLIGAIWQVREDLAFDVGFRHALTNGQSVNEIRAGLTFGFPLRPGSMPSALRKE